ncbi:MAG TPA: LacI family DNA-binding transcriptional regulator [Bryobacteraceae bacterium]|nr:LacI family DNA-binding transcriptional regulator [Bryobacteraceae bacterium]
MASKTSPAGIREVAELAGVSAATVSRILNGTRKFREETEHRVRAAARELGYSRNLAARALVQQKTTLLGMIISDMRNLYFPEVAAAFQDQALLHDMDVIVMNTNYDHHRALKCVQRLIGLQVAGVAVLTSEFDPTMRKMLAQRDIPVVYSDVAEVGRNISTLPADLESGIGQAIHHLKALGHKRLGYIGGPVHLLTARRRRKAFLDIATASGAEVQIVDSEFTPQGGYYGASRLFVGFSPTAIIAGNDMCAIGAMHWASDQGIRIPSQLSIVGYDDISFAPFTQPPLTTVALPRTELGRAAFLALKEMSESPSRMGKAYPMHPTLMVRQSTAPPSADPPPVGVSPSGPARMFGQ